MGAAAFEQIQQVFSQDAVVSHSHDGKVFTGGQASMVRRFDVVAIGTGSAASTVASLCRGAGRQVAVVDSRPFGGTCALRGCDPKKVLVGAGELVDWLRRMQGKGVPSSSRIDWPELMRFKRTFTDPIPKQREEGFRKRGIAAFHGRARFTSPTSLQVGDEALEARNIVIASGAKPAELRIPGAALASTSDDFLELEQLPKRIAFIGGGYISFEFGHLSARAGASVMILHRGPRPLVRFDPDLVHALVNKSRSIGIDIRLNTEVKAIHGKPGDLKVRVSSEGREQDLEADLVVHGAGRVPDIDDLELDRGNVAHDRRGVTVNEYLQSVSNPAVYAAGDAAATGAPQLTPVAGYDGRIVAANLLEGNHRKPDYRGVASVVFTVPPLAGTGLQEQEAREQGLRFRVNHADTSGWFSSRKVAEDCSGFKTLVEEGSGRILGAHLLGPQSEETINVFALAIRRGISAAEVKDTFFAYPTRGSDIEYML
jgi:glutathione reductase (NADPH)